MKDDRVYLQHIRDAVKNLSDGCKSREPTIPWKQIAGLRDKVIHDYVNEPRLSNDVCG